LAVVCVEAGLGLDQTIQRVGRELRLPHPDLGDELRLYSLETQAGRSRPEALRNLAERTGVEELRSFAAVLIQSDRFGTSVAQTLRVFSDDLRIKRRQKAEEAAAKLTVKIVPPLIFFIFPAILLVVAGPGILASFGTVEPLSRGGG
jgi:tight adherence protein C